MTSRGRRRFEVRRHVPKALDPKQDRGLGVLRDRIGRESQFLHEFDVRLLMPLKIDDGLAGVLESQNYAPQPRVFRLRVSDDLVETLARHVVERELGTGLEHANVAVVLAKRCPFELSEIAEPADAERADWLVA